MGRHYQLTRPSRSAWVRPLEHDSDVIPGNSSSWRGPGQLVTSWSCVESGVMFTPGSTSLKTPISGMMKKCVVSKNATSFHRPV